ncbi:endonuclease domain-containing protein, partial [bacterium]
EYKLGIEADGMIHDEPEKKAIEMERTKYLNNIDIKILRFTNKEIIENTEKVLTKNKKTINIIKINQQCIPPLLSLGEG